MLTIQGVPKVRSSTLYDCNVVRLDLVSKSFKQKLCCDSNVRFVYFALKVRVREYIFQPHIFVFCSPICSNSFLVFCEYHERKNPLNAKTFSYVRA